MDATTGRVEDTTNDHSQEWSGDIDISQLCRVCACTNEYLIPIFQGEGLEHELENKIKKHLPLSVSESDSLPLHLCYQCASTLIAWNDLVITCIESEEKFKQLVKLPEELDNIQSGKSCNKENEAESQPSNNAELFATVVKPGDTIIFQPADAICDNPMGDTSSMLPIINSVSSIETGSINEVPSNTRDVIYYNTEDHGQELAFIGDNTVVPEQLYEDVETPVVVQNFVEGLEGGAYIAYITDEFMDSTVKIIGDPLQQVAFVNESKPYICQICNRVFTDINLYKHHLTTHTTKGHFCTYCNVYYRRMDHLQKHMEIMHPGFVKDIPPVQKKVNPYAKTFLCNTCGKILKSTLAYENHTLKHQSKCPFICNLCSDTFPNRGARRKHEVKVHKLYMKEKGNPDGYHVCEVCGMELFSDGAYYHHKDKHGDPYPCSFCGKLYGSRSLMQVHARRHTTERPFVCTVCNRNFKVKQELNAHMNIHKDVRPYQCPHCPKMCRKSSDLTHHIRTHTGEKPFVCDICGRGFAQAGDMRKHRNLHSRPSKVNKRLPL